MRLVKLLLLGLIVASLAAMWSVGDSVVSAYADPPEALALRLGGVDLDVPTAEVELSPYASPAAPDTRNRAPVPAVAAGWGELVASLGDQVAEPIILKGGTAALAGVVEGPDGPVAGAVVSVERHTGEGSVSSRLTTDESGQWSLDLIQGGRYRVRAWVPDRLTMGRSEVLFLAEGQARNLAFSLWGVDPEPALGLVSTGPFHHGQVAEVAIGVTRKAIDADGVVKIIPLTFHPVAGSVAGPVGLASGTLTTTDGEGLARFLVQCPEVEIAVDEAPPVSHGVITVTINAEGLVGRVERTANFALPVCEPEPEPEPGSESEPEPEPRTEGDPGTENADG